MVPYRLAHVLLDLAVLGGLILAFLALLSPVAWHTRNHNVLSFRPVEPIACPLTTSTPTNTTLGCEDHSLRAVWIGPLGSCSRDDDGRVWCTKPSISKPQFNLTHVQPNETFTQSTIKSRVQTSLFIAILTLHLTSLLLNIIISLPWYIRPLLRHRAQFELSSHIMGLFMVFMTVTTFCMNWFVEVIDFAKLDGGVGVSRVFYVEPTVVMKIHAGDAFGMVWFAWMVCGLGGTAVFYRRVIWFDEKEVKEEAEAMKERWRVKAGERKVEEGGKEGKDEELKKEKVSVEGKVVVVEMKSKEKDDDDNATIVSDASSVVTLHV